MIDSVDLMAILLIVLLFHGVLECEDEDFSVTAFFNFSVQRKYNTFMIVYFIGLTGNLIGYFDMAYT